VWAGLWLEVFGTAPGNLLERIVGLGGLEPPTSLSLPKMLSGASAFEISDIERMNIGGHQPGRLGRNVTCPVVTRNNNSPGTGSTPQVKMSEVVFPTVVIRIGPRPPEHPRTSLHVSG
jgi:hypothetical protein